MRGWLREAIDRGVKAGIDDALNAAAAPGGLIEDVVWQVLDEKIERNRTLTRDGFVWAMALHLNHQGASRADAKRMAAQVLADYLADEKIAFGQSGYSWDRDGAEDVAEEYEINHWEFGE